MRLYSRRGGVDDIAWCYGGKHRPKSGVNEERKSYQQPRLAYACAHEGEKLECSWREACKAADYVLEHFGDREHDRGIWVWYCRRIGLEVFLDIADEVISCARQGEIKWPVKAFQRHLTEAFPKKGGAR